MTALIELQKLTKDYGRFRALSHIDLKIGPGVTGLLGPNGAGKSTLIKVLLGLVRTTSGAGFVLGQNIRTEAAEIRARVGYMPEDDCYMHGLSGIDSVQVAARLSCLPKIEGLRRGHEILDFCGVGQERYRNVETYSTGMRQKLRFAMSIVHDPELLILDEPTSGLDPEEREAMLNRISVLATKFEKSIILCTHILPDVKIACEHVAILAAGEVRLAAPLQELLKSRDPAVTLELADDAERLSARLKDQGFEVYRTANQSVQVTGEVESIASPIWNVAAEENIGIQNMTPSQSSLEEVFLKAVQEKPHADS